MSTLNAATFTLDPGNGGKLKLTEIDYAPTGYPWVGVQTSYQITAGRILTLHAQANPGFAIDNWYYNGVEAPQQVGRDIDAITLQGDTTLRVTFKPVESTFTLDPGSGGKLKLTEIDYAPTGHPWVGVRTSYQIATGRILTLHAQANAGFTIDKWFYNGVEAPQQVGRNIDAITLQGDTTLRVTFKPVESTFTLDPGSGGKLKLTEIDYVDTGHPWVGVQTSYQIAAGRILTLHAQANPGFAIDKWFYNGVEAPQQVGRNIDAITLQGDTTLRVTFKPVESTFTLDPGNGGKLKLTEIDYAPTGHPWVGVQTSYQITAGRILTLHAQANPGFAIDKWFYNGVEAAQQVGRDIDAITLQGDTTLRVTFKPVESTFTLDPGSGGKLKLTEIDYAPTGHPWVAVQTSYQIAAGRILTLHAEANAGFAIDKWFYNGVEAAQQVGRDIDAITLQGDTTLRVTFKPVESTFTLDPGNGGKLKLTEIDYAPTGYPWVGVQTSYQITAGRILTLHAQANPGFAIDNWYYNGVEAPQQVGRDIDAITLQGDTTLRVTFKPVESTFTLDPGSGGKLKLTEIDYAPTGHPWVGSQTSYQIAAGRILTLHAQANPGFAIDKWFYNGVEAPQQVGRDIDAITLLGDTTLRVTFSRTLQIRAERVTAEEICRLRWQTEPGVRYELQRSTDLHQWTTVTGYPREAQGLSGEHSFEVTEHTGFFRILMLDE